MDDTNEPDVDNINVSDLAGYVMGKYKKAEDYRYEDEQRWVRAYRNYRGLYGPDVQFTEAEKSRVFIKVTKTKTLAAYGQIADVLFAGGKFPISIEPTELPEGVTKDVNFDPKKPINISLIYFGGTEIFSHHNHDNSEMLARTLSAIECRTRSERQKTHPAPRQNGYAGTGANMSPRRRQRRSMQ